jgi:hypothetical protein
MKYEIKSIENGELKLRYVKIKIIKQVLTFYSALFHVDTSPVPKIMCSADSSLGGYQGTRFVDFPQAVQHLGELGRVPLLPSSLTQPSTFGYRQAINNVSTEKAALASA